jgi:hypothetical protein
MHSHVFSKLFTFILGYKDFPGKRETFPKKRVGKSSHEDGNKLM